MTIDSGVLAQQIYEQARQLSPENLADLAQYVEFLRFKAQGATKDRVTSSQVAQPLGLSQRMARNLLQGWVDDGLLVVVDASKRKRAYGLSAIYRQYIGSLTAMPLD